MQWMMTWLNEDERQKLEGVKQQLYYFTIRSFISLLYAYWTLTGKAVRVTEPEILFGPLEESCSGKMKWNERWNEGSLKTYNKAGNKPNAI